MKYAEKIDKTQRFILYGSQWNHFRGEFADVYGMSPFLDGIINKTTVATIIAVWCDIYTIHSLHLLVCMEALPQQKDVFFTDQILMTYII